MTIPVASEPVYDRLRHDLGQRFASHWRPAHRYHDQQPGGTMTLTRIVTDLTDAFGNAEQWFRQGREQHLPALAAAAAEADAAAEAAASDPLARAVAAAGNLPAEARELAAKVIGDLAAMYPAPAEAAESDSGPPEGETQAEVPGGSPQDATEAPEAAAATA